jgi:HEAT repeat protein
LIQQLHGNRHPQWIARQLASSADPAARAALLAAAATGKGEAASAAVRALGEVRGKGVDDALLAALHGGSPGVATEALEQLAKRRGRAALPLLIGALREGGGELRGAALAAMAELGEPSTRGLLLAAAKQQDRGAASAIRGLVKLGGPDLPETLLSIVKSGKRAAGDALEALAELGGPQARAALLDGLASSDYRVSHAATSGLARSRDPELGSKLQQLIADPTVSTEAKQRILSVWADREDRVALLEATRSPDRAVAKEALETLGKCGGPDAERALGSAIGAGEPEQRQAAVKGLRELATPGAVRSLGQALFQPKLLEEATAALVSIGSRDAIRAVGDRYLAASPEERLTILGQLDEPNPWSRTLLATALESGDQRIALAAGRALSGYLGDGERRRLLQALGGGAEAAVALQSLRSRLSTL